MSSTILTARYEIGCYYQSEGDSEDPVYFKVIEDIGSDEYVIKLDTPHTQKCGGCSITCEAVHAKYRCRDIGGCHCKVYKLLDNYIISDADLYQYPIKVSSAFGKLKVGE